METQLLIYLAIALILSAGFLVLWIKLKNLFKGFRKLKTESDIQRLRQRSRLVRGLFHINHWFKHIGKNRNNSLRFVNACRSGDVEQVEKIIEKGIDVNARRHRGGRTGLMFAAQKNHLEVVKLLLKKGADVNASGGGSGHTALIRAAENGNHEIVEVLLKHGAIVDLQSRSSGKTALMKASEGGFLEVVACLVQSGAALDKTDRSGRTALFLAIHPFNKRACAIVSLIAEAGANLGIVDDNGKSPLDRSREFALKECEEILLMHGAVSGGHENAYESQDTGSREIEAYKILGCNKSDSDEIVKNRFREMIKQYHPDTIAGKDLPEDFTRFASEKFVEVQEAYRLVMDSRGERRSR